MVRRSRRISRRRSGRVSRRRVSRRRVSRRRVSRRRSRRRMSGGMFGIGKKKKKKFQEHHTYSQATQDALKHELIRESLAHFFTPACVKSQSSLLKATLDQDKQRDMSIQSVIIALEKSLGYISKKDKASVRSVIDILTKTLSGMDLTEEQRKLLPPVGESFAPADEPLARQPSVDEARLGSPISEQRLDMLEQQREQQRRDDAAIMGGPDLSGVNLPPMQ